MKKINKGTAIAAISAIGIASVVTIAGVVSKTLKRNLIKDLNDSDFKDDSYDEVLRHRKGRYYQKMGMY